MPAAWAGDSAWRDKAYVPETVTFATKLQIAGVLITAALDAGAPCAWVLADALYGSGSRLRWLREDRRQPNVMAVRSNLHFQFVTSEGLVQTDPAEAAHALAAEAWTTHAAGEGTKGIRLYDWVRIELPWTAGNGFERWILIRRNRKNPAEREYYLVFSKAGTALSEVAGAAGPRWTIEDCFQRAKEELGLDHCEVRSWHGLHRHITLCMAAAAFLARLSAQLRQSIGSKKNKKSPPSGGGRTTGVLPFGHSPGQCGPDC